MTPVLKTILPNFMIPAEKENFYITVSAIGGNRILSAILNTSLSIIPKKRKTTPTKGHFFKEKCLQELADKLNVGEGNLADYIDLKRAMVELSKEKLNGRVVRGRLTQPIEEEEVGAAHLIQEKKAGEKKTIEALTSESGEILTSETQKANFIFDYFTKLCSVEMKKNGDHQEIASPLDSISSCHRVDVWFKSGSGQLSFLH